MRAGESFKLVNVAAGTYAVTPNSGNVQALQGGHYFLDFICTGSPSFALNVLGPDGTTWTPVLPIHSGVGFAGTPALVNAAGTYWYFYLPAGKYEIVIGTSTANYVSLTRIQTSE